VDQFETPHAGHLEEGGEDSQHRPDDEPGGPTRHDETQGIDDREQEK